jgi:hypothetical protein
MKGHRITQISTQGLRATDRKIDLEPLTLIRGPIGAGKTSVCDAIRIAMLGCVPSIGKDAKSIARLMRNGELRVQLLLDDGRKMERGYIRKGESLKGAALASWMPPKSNLTDVTEAIRSLVGRDDREASEHLDLRQLLQCSPAERARRIEELLDASGIPLEEQVLRAHAMTILRLADVSPDKMPADVESLETAAKGAKALLGQAIKHELAGFPYFFQDELKAGGIPRALAMVNEKKKEASEGLRRRIAARAEMEDRVTTLNAPAESLKDLEARREIALTTMAMAQRDLKETERIAAVRAELEPVIPILRQAVTEADEKLKRKTDQIPKAKEAIAEAEALQDPPEVDAPPVIEADPEKLAEADRLSAQGAELLHKANTFYVPEPLSIANEEANHKAALQALEKAKESPWREVEKIADEFEQYGITCGISLIGIEDPFLRLRRLAAEHGGNLEVLEDDEVIRESELEDARERQYERSKEIKATKASQQELYRKAEELRKNAESVREKALAAAKADNAKRREEYALKVGEREVKVDEITQRRRELTRLAETIRGEVLEAERAHDKAVADLRASEERLAGIASVTIDAAHAKATHEAAAKEIDGLNDQIELLRGAESLRAEMKKLINEIEAATAARDIWTAAEWALQRLREMDLAARATGLQERMRRYLKAAGRKEDPYLRAGRGQTDFGWRRNGQEISVEALSGGETCLFTATLAGAIISLRSPELRILPVEGAEIGIGDEAVQLLSACREMVASGDLDQVLIATCNPIEPINGYQVIDLAAETVEARA